MENLFIPSPKEESESVYHGNLMGTFVFGSLYLLCAAKAERDYKTKGIEGYTHNKLDKASKEIHKSLAPTRKFLSQSGALHSMFDDLEKYDALMQKMFWLDEADFDWLHGLLDQRARERRSAAEAEILNNQNSKS